ncbi:MAG: TrmJ/YjtD family RNA methyltransferase [Terriglobales bacterium]
MISELDHLRVVLVSARNPLNIGAAARAMSNFGVRRLRVVSPYEVAFREARSAMGAAKLLANAEEYKTVAEAVADCTLVVGTTAVGHRELQHPLRRLEDGARLIRRRLGAGKVALLFGSEKVGLSNRDLSYCHWLMRIPTRAEHASMNLGQAVAVCLYELVRPGKSQRKKARQTPAAAGAIERITKILFQALRESGYVKPRAAEATEDKVRRMVRRLQLEARDAELWLGMLRQIAWKLGSDEGPGG